MQSIARAVIGAGLLLSASMVSAPTAEATDWLYCIFHPSKCICKSDPYRCRKAPEINAAGAPAAALLVLGGVAVVVGRRRRKNQ
ncbi:MAG: hypothetical protein OXU20_23825 [Myxococcales bacterium]|nr:hypothetical protein [Myxococcales bacterium]MDD9967383.1 hypothetical protein [Myxococcales bacterium]